MSRIVPTAACAALLLSLAAAAPGTSSPIRWDNGKVTRIGAMDLSRTPTIKLPPTPSDSRRASG